MLEVQHKGICLLINSIVGSSCRGWLTLSTTSPEIDCKPRIGVDNQETCITGNKQSIDLNREESQLRLTVYMKRQQPIKTYIQGVNSQKTYTWIKQHTDIYKGLTAKRLNYKGGCHPKDSYRGGIKNKQIYK